MEKKNAQSYFVSIWFVDRRWSLRIFIYLFFSCSRNCDIEWLVRGMGCWRRLHVFMIKVVANKTMKSLTRTIENNTHTHTPSKHPSKLKVSHNGTIDIFYSNQIIQTIFAYKLYSHIFNLLDEFDFFVWMTFTACCDSAKKSSRTRSNAMRKKWDRNKLSESGIDISDGARITTQTFMYVHVVHFTIFNIC